MVEENLVEEEKKEYANKVVFLRKSAKGGHLFVYDSKEYLEPGASLIMNVSEVQQLIDEQTVWVKVSIVSAKDRTDKQD